MKQRLVAEQQVQYYPCGGGAENDGPQHGRVHVAHHFFESEEHRRHGSVEGRRERRRAPHRNQFANFART